MEEDISDVISLLYIFAEHVLQKVYALLFDFRPNLFLEVWLRSQNALFNFLASGPCEWHLATEELVCQDTEAPNIAPKVARLLQNHLRGLVPECATLLLEEFIVLKDASQTKVSDFD